MTQTIGIDVATRHARTLATKLGVLKNVLRAEIAGAYTEDPSICQIHLDIREGGEDWVDDWLYTRNHKCEYYGTFVVSKEGV